MRCSGNGSIVAQVTSVQYTSPAAKAGVMFRDSTTAANAAMAMLAVTPGSGLMFETRTSDGGLATLQFLGGYTTPIWLKLSRAGSVFTAWYSVASVASGISWIEVGSPVTMTASEFSSGSTAYVGLAVTAHNAAALNTSTFFDVSVSGTIAGGPVQIGPDGRHQRRAGDAGPLVLTANMSIVPPAGTTLTISGDISEASPGTALSLDGPGTLVLSGTNTYSGGTAVDAGTLVLTSAMALPSGTPLTVAAGGVVVFDPAATVAATSVSVPSASVPSASTAAIGLIGPIGPIPDGTGKSVRGWK